MYQKETAVSGFSFSLTYSVERTSQARANDLRGSADTPYPYPYPLSRVIQVNIVKRAFERAI